MSKLPTSVHIPAGTLSADEWAALIEAYATDPDVQESILRTLTILSSPGVTFTEDQKALIRALPADEAARAVRDLLD